MANTKNIIISGVGGQGILTASEILALCAMEEGLDVKKSEVHGMSQRGGSVVSFVKFGEKVYSPLIEKGSGDVILAFEKAEALRWRGYLKKTGGVVIMNTLEIYPNTVSLGLDTYPENIREEFEKYNVKTIEVDAVKLSKEAGDPRTQNTVLLGVLSNFIDFSVDTWIKVIKRRVPPKTTQANLKAFELGREVIK